jgi:S1-C subfamily serine protease
VLVAFQGEPVASIDDLQRRLVASEIGVESPITLLRRTELIELKIRPQETPGRSSNHLN